MSTDMASVGLRVDSRQVRTASGDLDRFARSGDKAGRSANRATSAFSAMGKGMAVAAASALAAVVSIAALSSQLNRFIDATVTNEKAQAQLGAAILSTGGAAGRTVAQLNEHAAALQKITNFGDEATNAMQGVLLTFTQIKGDQFDAATVAIQNVATAMNQDLTAAALQVGKALNDPVLGMTALGRSGITFTEAQKDMVKEMVAANDIIGAQTLILAELETQFGGSAEAARDTLGGALGSLRNAFGDLFELSGPGSENLRASIERLTAAVANPAFFAAVQSIGTGLFAAAEMGVNALTMLLPVITAVVENIDVIGYSAGIAAAVFAGSYVAAMGAAAVASFSLTGALAVLKTALISTGIGALIVGAGYLVAMFGRLVKAAGGFGEALGILKDVALEVWERIGLGVDFVAKSIAVMSASAQAFFIGAVRKMAGAFVEFTWTVADGLNSLFGTSLQGASAVITQELAVAQVAAENLLAASTAAANAAKDGFSAPLKSIQALRDVMTESADATEDATAEAEAMNAALEDIGGDGTTGSGGGSAGKAAAAIEEATTFAGGFAEAMADGTKSAVEMGRELGGSLLSGIGSVSDAFGDFIMRGFTDFKGFVASILDSFKSMLAQMISMAVRNRIMLSIGASGGGVGQAVAGAAGGGGASGGMLSGLVGSFGTGGGMAGLANGAGFLGGVGNVLGGLASGGLSGGIGAIGTALGGATASLGGFAMAAGAIAVPLLAIAGIFMAFRTKTKELDAGIIATVTGMDTLVQSFRTVEKSRFFGLFKSVSTTIGAAGQATTDAITDIVGTLQGSVMASADALGLAGDTFEDFSHRMKISTKGLSEEAANEAVQEALMGMADAMAGMVSGLDAFARDGEGAAGTLERLAQSLIVVNSRMTDLGLNTYDVSLAGGAAAASFVDLFGSLDAFVNVAGSYYQNFFTDAERLARATELLSIEMLALGIDALPSTRAAFRALIDEADALGDTGLVASLMQLSPAFAEISAGADALGNSLRSLVNEDLFTTGQDFTRALSRASNSQTFTPQQSDAELRAELRALNVSMERLVSTSEITAGNTGRGADAADDTLAFQLEQTL